VNFEEEQLRATQARLDGLDNVIQTEGGTLVRYEQTKQQIEAEIQGAEASIEELKDDLTKANEDLENRTTQVEQAKKVFNKAAKAVDQVLKDIATKARGRAVYTFQRHVYNSLFRMVRSRSSV
jgi:structural maintenance of chromosome 1